jgi:DivIVA domain-containing protein
MPFAPHEIENKRFVVALRGYQTDEVDAFLRAVAADYRAAIEITQNNRRNQPETNPELIADIERFWSAREVADQEAALVRAAAEQDAAEVRAAAQREAADIRAAVEAEAEAFYEEIARQANELQAVERRVRDQLHVLERVVIEGKHSLTGLAQVTPRTDF